MPNDRYRVAVLFAAWTGCRAGEVWALQVRHIDTLRKRVLVEASISEVPGGLVTVRPKNNRARYVTMPGFLVELVAQACAGKGPDDYVFGSARDTSRPQRHTHFALRVFRPAVQDVFFQTELEAFTFHGLRHTCASLLYSQGAGPKEIMAQLGHSDIRITMNRYAHLFGNDVEALADKMDTLYRTASTPQQDVNVVNLR